MLGLEYLPVEGLLVDVRGYLSDLMLLLLCHQWLVVIVIILKAYPLILD